VYAVLRISIPLYLAFRPLNEGQKPEITGHRSIYTEGVASRSVVVVDLEILDCALTFLSMTSQLYFLSFCSNFLLPGVFKMPQTTNCQTIPRRSRKQQQQQAAVFWP